MKRGFDLLASGLGLLVLAPLLLLIAVLVKLTSKGPIFFHQQRVGRNFAPFWIHKFRTMVPNAPSLGGALTVGHDPRVTTIGRLLRKCKLDELPQLFNVFKGDMSLVGPRPEVPKYVELFRNDYVEILQVRPGITDRASICFRNESELMGRASDPERLYVEEILPQKIAFAKQYVRESSLATDVGIILSTLWAVAGGRPPATPAATHQSTESP